MLLLSPAFPSAWSPGSQAAPELKKAVRKSDKAADRLDAAKAAVPVKPPGKEHGNPLSRPVQEIRSTLHGEVSKVEGDNSGGINNGRRPHRRARYTGGPAASIQRRHHGRGISAIGT